MSSDSSATSRLATTGLIKERPMTARTDIHRPSAIIPSEYDYVCVRTHDAFDTGFALIEQRVYNAHKARTGAEVATHVHGGNCHICGAWFMDYAVFHHVPSNEYIHAGLDCSQHIDSGHEDAFRQIGRQRRAAAKSNKARKETADALDAMGLLEQVEVYFMPDDLGGALAGCDKKQDTNLFGAHIFGVTDAEFKPYVGSFEILIDLVRKMHKYGLSDKQKAFLSSLCDKFANLPRTMVIAREKRDALPDAPTGNVDIEGVVISIKSESYSPSYYTTVYTDKMTIRTTEGYLVYVTVPSSISEVEKGCTVKLNVTLTPSVSDPKFAIGKRPYRAKILSTGETQCLTHTK
jgi:hypothetical protein